MKDLTQCCVGFSQLTSQTDSDFPLVAERLINAKIPIH